MEHNHMPLRSHENSTPGGHLHHPKHKLQTSSDPASLYDDKRQSQLQSSSYPPPSYAQAHDAASLSFPDAPTTELAPIQPHGGDHNSTLPSLSSLTAPQPQPYTSPKPTEPSSCSPPPAGVNRWPSLNPLTAFYEPGHAQAADVAQQRMDVDATSTSTMSVASPDRFYEGRASTISLDDPDVRIAAEALGDLRADFVSSPPSGHTPLPLNSPSRLSPQAMGPEPLLSLLTTSHPLLATTIEGATSAYNNSKNFSPTFKTSAEYVEGYLGPIANTVGTVGRKTGVEGGVRWFLGAGRRHQSSTSDLEAGDGGSNKRRKVDSSDRDGALDAVADKADDIYGFTRDRRTSMSTVDTLPAYDEFRSPAYSETVDGQNRVTSRPGSGASAAWQHRIIMSTSGLSIAMRDESLRSLKYCLRWLRWANEHISAVITALKTALDEYDGSGSTERRGSQDSAVAQGSDHTMAGTTSTPTAEAGVSQQDRNELAARIAALRSDVLKTLRGVIDTVSKYAGGALPDNARVLVHRHLISLPRRFWLASMQDAPAREHGDGAQEKEVREGAKRALVLAKEGLDMVSQVTGVVDGTIVSAEEWCNRLGRKKDGGSDAEPAADGSAPQQLTGVGVDRDVTMG